MTKQDRQFVSRRVQWSAAWLGLILLTALAGCGGGGRQPVTGKVVYKGEPVKGGTVVLSPLASGDSKPASGEVGDDGTFSLGTNAEKDGVMTGKYKVGYTA